MKLSRRGFLSAFGAIGLGSRVVKGNKPSHHFTVTGRYADTDWPVTYMWVNDSYFPNNVVAESNMVSKEVRLNKSFASEIDHSLIAHEYGHQTSELSHTDGTVMDYTLHGYEDKNEDVELSETTIRVFEKMDNMYICDWGNNSVEALQKVVMDYGSNSASMDTLSYAVTQYGLGSGSDIYYQTNWNKFGGYDDVPKENYACCQFYRK